MSVEEGNGAGTVCNKFGTQDRGSSVNQGIPSSAVALDLRTMYLSRAKLKASSGTSALLVGFAMVALVELSLEKDEGDLDKGLYIFYAVCTSLLVSVHLLALMMSTCILPHIDAIAASDRHLSVTESPHNTLRVYIEMAWFFSTVLGLFLFLIEIACVFWLKFERIYKPAAYAAMGITVPVLVIFVCFALTFYRKLASFRMALADVTLQEMDSHLRQGEPFPNGLARLTFKSMATNMQFQDAPSSYASSSVDDNTASLVPLKSTAKIA